MHGGTVMTEDLEDEKSILNKSDPHINRGVELLNTQQEGKTRTAQNFSGKVW